MSALQGHVYGAGDPDRPRALHVQHRRQTAPRLHLQVDVGKGTGVCGEPRRGAASGGLVVWGCQSWKEGLQNPGSRPAGDQAAVAREIPSSLDADPKRHGNVEQSTNSGGPWDCPPSRAPHFQMEAEVLTPTPPGDSGPDPSGPAPAQRP